VNAGLLAPLNPELLRYDVGFHVASRKRAYLNDITLAFLEDLKQVHLTMGAPSV
jgi:hypothetical protein